ncbi:GPW/gp25 family protein [Prosthecochloris sp. SCSIO W1102]|uniref:GPW/gp25 family protein n=1 Tax=Prosthecochloris sp. SCSIO W1102 TaxID=2992243 RepID=UPI00223DC10F|nr:GPW/gp25 family protein [Prosthecochloris sp. SCSIO W1102]UZJ39149.1 GPW/gp25 family protein [Prosthecochloris sp. SCSIO W1102]
MNLLSEIISKDFQMRLYGKSGEVVVDDDDVSQCLAVIVMTRPGEVPHEPEFGCDLWEYVDSPVNEVQLFVSTAVINAVRRWEPRVEVLGVAYEYSADFSGLAVEVKYRRLDNLTERVLVLPVGDKL